MNEHTQAQMATLLASAGVLTNLLTASHRAGVFDDDGDLIDRPELDGGVKCAAESALIRVCDRIERIASDDDRWNTEGLGNVETAVLELLNAETYQASVRAETMNRMGAPHVLLRATVGINSETGMWLCFTNTPLESKRVRPLIGIGSTAEEACQNFDDQFYAEQKTMDRGRDDHLGPITESKHSDGSPGTGGSVDCGDKPSVGTPPTRASRKKPRRRADGDGDPGGNPS